MFFPETLIERTANGVHINPQVNAQKQGEHPFIVQNIQAFTLALFDLFAQLDTNKELHLPKSKIHQKMLRPLLDDRLTGLSFLNLMAYHMVKIVEKNDNPNEYLAVVDQNVIAGIPDAFQYICKFILACRKYNEKQGAFTVQFASAINLDNPISGKLTPVAGSAQGKMVAGMCSFTVQADGTISEGVLSSINTDSGKPKRQPGTSKPKPTGKKSNDEVGKAQQKKEVSQALSKEDKQKGSDKLAEDCVDKATDEKAAKRHAEEALRDWQLACNQINTERAKLVDKWKSELHAKYDRQLAELEQVQSNERAVHSKKCAELSENTAQLQKELETAGLFAFSKKKELKAKIFDAQTDESNAAKEGANLNTRQTNEKKAL